MNDIEMALELCEFHLAQAEYTELINLLYKYIHCVNKKSGCYKTHEDWRKEMREDYKKLLEEKKHGRKTKKSS